jgi:hypothetical protein
MSDGSVDAHGLGDLGRRPFSLVYVEVEQDPTSRRILQRGDGSVDLGEWFITHAGSLSTANADGRAQEEILASLDGSASSRDFERADRIGSYWGNPKTRTFAEPLIDCEEDRTLRAVLVGMLRDFTLGARSPATSSCDASAY